MRRTSLALASLLVVGLATVSCGSSDETPPPTSSASEPSSTTLEVTAEDFAYVPDTIEIDAGSEITLLNRGYAFHDMKVEGEDGVLISEIESGGQASAVVDLEPGRYVIFCTIPKHRPQGMEGTLIVR